jgi:hypothetical protein
LDGGLIFSRIPFLQKHRQHRASFASRAAAAAIPRRTPASAAPVGLLSSHAPSYSAPARPHRGHAPSGMESVRTEPPSPPPVGHGGSSGGAHRPPLLLRCGLRLPRPHDRAVVRRCHLHATEPSSAPVPRVVRRSSALPPVVVESAMPLTAAL